LVRQLLSRLHGLRVAAVVVVVAKADAHRLGGLVCGAAGAAGGSRAAVDAGARAAAQHHRLSAQRSRPSPVCSEPDRRCPVAAAAAAATAATIIAASRALSSADCAAGTAHADAAVLDRVIHAVSAAAANAVQDVHTRAIAICSEPVSQSLSSSATAAPPAPAAPTPAAVVLCTHSHECNRLRPCRLLSSLNAIPFLSLRFLFPSLFSTVFSRLSTQLILMVFTKVAVQRNIKSHIKEA
ncbi:hypothetical protein GQ42DRAFT_12661, partial [Ramicandelaber brevisporus]